MRPTETRVAPAGPRGSEIGLFALSDRGQDLADCVALEPSAEELAEALPWLEQQDLNPLWPAHVRATVENLSRKLGHGL